MREYGVADVTVGPTTKVKVGPRTCDCGHMVAYGATAVARTGRRFHGRRVQAAGAACMEDLYEKRCGAGTLTPKAQHPQTGPRVGTRPEGSRRRAMVPCSSAGAAARGAAMEDCCRMAAPSASGYPTAVGTRRLLSRLIAAGGVAAGSRRVWLGWRFHAHPVQAAPATCMKDERRDGPYLPEQYS